MKLYYCWSVPASPTLLGPVVEPWNVDRELDLECCEVKSVESWQIGDTCYDSINLHLITCRSLCSCFNGDEDGMAVTGQPMCLHPCEMFYANQN